MSLVKWKNRNELMPVFPKWLDSFFRDDDFFSSQWTREMTIPAVNVTETDNAFQLEVAVPGMKKEDFKVEVRDDMLYICAESKVEKEEKKKNYTRREFSFSNFSRTFWMPDDVLPDEIKASYNDGILYVTVPKKQVSKTPSKVIDIT